MNKLRIFYIIYIYFNIAIEQGYRNIDTVLIIKHAVLHKIIINFGQNILFFHIYIILYGFRCNVKAYKYMYKQGLFYILIICPGFL